MTRKARGPQKGPSPPDDKRGGGVYMSPEKAGDFKMKPTNPFHMSINELIDYKSSGRQPKSILDVNTVYKLACKGASLKTIGDLFEISDITIMNNEVLIAAHRDGLANLNTRNRMMIVDHASNGNLAAAIHLDKILNQDTQKVELTVTNNDHLKDISDEDLMLALEKKDD